MAQPAAVTGAVIPRTSTEPSDYATRRSSSLLSSWLDDARNEPVWPF
jgi:hypothetical protein